MADLKSLFRPKALERLSTPERLDLLLRISAPRTWIPILALALVFGFAIGWAFLGRLLVTVDGYAVFLDPHGVASFQAPSAGRVREVRVRPGDRVAKGDLLAVIDLPELSKDIEHQKTLVAQTAEDQAQELDGLTRRQDRERALLGQRRKDLERTVAGRRAFYDTRGRRLNERVKALRELAESEKKAQLELISGQRASLEEPMRQSKARIASLEKRLASLRELRGSGTVSDSDIDAAQAQVNDEAQRKMGLENQIDQLHRDEQEVSRVYNQRANAIQDVEIQIDQNEVDRESLSQEEQDLQKVSVEEARLEQESSDMRIRHSQKLEEARRSLARLEVSVAEQGLVHSESDARVLEVLAAAGQVVTPGQELGTLMRVSTDPAAEIQCDAYFSVNDGKKIDPDRLAQVSPDFVKRERFGSIVGRVESAEPYPVTTDSVASLVGNRELAQRLTSGGRLVQVRIRLQRDKGTPSGYAWTTSRGPDLAITSGSTATVRVVVEERSPISFVVPFLRSLGGE